MFVSLFAVSKIDDAHKNWGRRPLLLMGCVIMAIGQLALAVTFNHQRYIDDASDNDLRTFFYLSFSSLTVIGYALSFGLIATLLQTESFPTIIRGRSMSITIVMQSFAAFVVNATFLPITENDSYEFVFYLFFVFCCFSLMYVYVFIPETCGQRPSQNLIAIKTIVRNVKHLFSLERKENNNEDRSSSVNYVELPEQQSPASSGLNSPVGSNSTGYDSTAFENPYDNQFATSKQIYF